MNIVILLILIVGHSNCSRTIHTLRAIGLLQMFSDHSNVPREIANG